MSDLIDKQQAIEAICMETCGVSLSTKIESECDALKKRVKELEAEE